MYVRITIIITNNNKNHNYRFRFIYCFWLRYSFAFSDSTMKDVTSRLSNLVTEYYNQNVKLNEKITELEEQIRVVKYQSM